MLLRIIIFILGGILTAPCSAQSSLRSDPQFLLWDIQHATTGALRIKKIDEYIVFIFTDGLPDSKTPAIDLILSKRESECRADLVACASVARVLQAICRTEDPHAYDKLQEAYWNSLVNSLTHKGLPDDKITAILADSLASCNTVNNSANLVARLDLLKLALEKNWFGFANRILSNLTAKTNAPPADISDSLAQIANGIRALSGIRPFPVMEVAQLIDLSLGWTANGRLSDAKSDTQSDWASTIAGFLPMRAQEKKFYELALKYPELKAPKEAYQAVQTLDVLCSYWINSGNPANCQKELDDLRANKRLQVQGDLNLEIWQTRILFYSGKTAEAIEKLRKLISSNAQRSDDMLAWMNFHLAVMEAMIGDAVPSQKHLAEFDSLIAKFASDTQSNNHAKEILVARKEVNGTIHLAKGEFASAESEFLSARNLYVTLFRGSTNSLVSLDLNLLLIAALKKSAPSVEFIARRIDFEVREMGTPFTGSKLTVAAIVSASQKKKTGDLEALRKALGEKNPRYLFWEKLIHRINQ